MENGRETSGSSKRPMSIAILIAVIVLVVAVVFIMIFMLRRGVRSISIEEAKEIALADAGVSTNEVTYTKEELDRNDGETMYELEFHTGDMKYQYEVNGKTGNIYSKSKETVASQKTMEGSSSGNDGAAEEGALSDTPPKETLPTESEQGEVQQETEPENQAGQITIEEAKNVALSDAGVDASQAVFTKEQSDYEDGIPVYDLEFYTSTTEYEYEINAETGAVYSKKADAHGTGSGHSGHYDDTEHPDNTQHYNGTEHTGNLIGEDEAKNIAVNHAGLSLQDVNLLKVELDTDDGQSVYEVEFYKENQEYDYKIDAWTGNIIEYSMD